MADEGEGEASPPEHTYPSDHGRGVDPILDQAWDILDAIKPGVIPVEVRTWLCGQFVGILSKHLEKVRVRVPPLEEAKEISPQFYSQFIAAKNMAQIGFLTMGEESFSATLSGVITVIRQHLTLEQAQQLLRGFAMTMPDIDALERGQAGYNEEDDSVPLRKYGDPDPDASTDGVNADHE